ncbi:hypothetical protein [Micromonospora chalcea]|uniref:hypothetical protein n=1 Tax=Micromonospora chalcea TaxID=1874 RepID=UPI003D74B1FD
MRTQRFYVVMATDGDVEEREIGEVLGALGYRGLLVLDGARVDPHEHPCPASWCIEKLREEGHAIPDGTDCCVCWGAARQVSCVPG